jgi:NADH-quinone oxidoreductase subunit E
MGFVLTQESKTEFEKWGKKFPATPEGRQSLVIPALWICQRQQGWINREAIDFVAEATGTTPMHVWGVATFYTMFHKEKVGKTVFQFCTNIACGLLGGEELMNKMCKKFNIEPGGTTTDENISIFEVECLGACGKAPVVQINDKYHTNITDEELEKLILQFNK